MINSAPNKLQKPPIFMRLVQQFHACNATSSATALFSTKRTKLQWWIRKTPFLQRTF